MAPLFHLAFRGSFATDHPIPAQTGPRGPGIPATWRQKLPLQLHRALRIGAQYRRGRARACRIPIRWIIQIRQAADTDFRCEHHVQTVVACDMPGRSVYQFSLNLRTILTRLWALRWRFERHKQADWTRCLRRICRLAGVPMQREKQACRRCCNGLSFRQEHGLAEPR